MAGHGKIKQQQGKKKMNNIIKKFGRMNDEQLDQLFKSLDERKDINWPYIAGWIDGDGFIGALNKQSYGITLKIVDKEPVEMLSELFKCSLSQAQMDKRAIFKSPPKRRYYVVIRGEKAIYLAKKIAPFIMEKTKNLYKTLEYYGCNEKFPYMELNNEDFINYLVGFSEAEGCFFCSKELNNYNYCLANSNLNLLTYLERRLKQLGFFKFKIRTLRKEGFYFFNKNITDKIVYKKTSYRLEMNGYALLDFYNLIKDKLIINRKKEKVLATIKHFKDYRGISYVRYMKEKESFIG
jgi:hypothetical protein